MRATLIVIATLVAGVSADVGTCLNSPDDLESVVQSMQPQEALDVAVQCGDAELTQVINWKPESIKDDMECSYEFRRAESLGPCCGGSPSQNERSIEVNTDFSDIGKIAASITVDIVLENKKQDCCDECKCWGDPHCTPFGSSGQNTKTFMACDTAKIKDGNKCTSRLEVSEAAMNRCLGLTEGFEQNGNDLCRWRPLTEEGSYDPKVDGAPCVPNYRVEAKIFEAPFPESAGGSEISSLSQKEGLKLSVFTGERGSGLGMRFANIKYNKKGKAKTTGAFMELDLLKSCTYFRNEVNQENAPLNDIQSAMKADFISEDGRFTMSRTVKFQQIQDGQNVGAIDMNWNLFDIQSGMAVNAVCMGAVDASTEPAGLSTFRSLLSDLDDDVSASGMLQSLGYANADALTSLYKVFTHTVDGVSGADLGAQSTRDAKDTMLNMRIFASKVDGSNTEGAGFCFTGEFEEFNNPDWFGATENVRSEICGVNKNLDFKDREIVRAFNGCDEVMSEYECSTFEDYEGIEFAEKEIRNHFREYMTNLEKCIINYCGDAFLPAGTSTLECVTEFYDFGSEVATQVYPPKSDNDIDQQESTVPVVQPNCEEWVEVVYQTEERHANGEDPIVKSWSEGDGPIVIMEQGTPRVISVTQNSCAGVCGTRPQLDFNLKIDTECEGDDDDYVCYKRSDSCDACTDACEEKCA